MPGSRGTLNVSDSVRDAGKYYKLLLAIENAREKIHNLQSEEHTNIDEVLVSLLPDLVGAFEAARGFVALHEPGERRRARRFRLLALFPNLAVHEEFLPWSETLDQILSTSKARVVKLFEDSSRRLIEGLEMFEAVTALLVPMEIGNHSWIIGLCNRSDPDAGPFLAADRRALESIIELIAIGMRVGERRRQELENIQKISAAINAELDPVELLDLIAKKAADVFSASAASLMLWDKKGENLIIEASHGLTRDYVRRQHIAKKDVDAVMAGFENERTFITADLQKDPFGNLDLIKTERLRSVLRAKLQASDELIGILNIYSQDLPRSFNENERDLAEIFANHAAIAIRNARLRQRKLESILDSAEALKATFDENELLQLIALKVSGVFNAPVSLMFWDPTGRNLEIKATHGFAEDHVNRKFVTRDPKLRRRVSKSFEIADLRAAMYGLQHLCKQEQLHNALVAPLASPGSREVSGFLFIYGKAAPRTFTSEEIKIAGIIAGQAAIAIRTTQLHGQSKQRGEQLNALDRIALGITGELKIRELLQSIIQSATELMQASGGMVYLWEAADDDYKPLAAWGKPDLKNAKIDKRRGILAEIIRTKAPFAVPYYFRWSKRQTSLDKYRLKATVGVPILSEERLLGVIVVHDTEGDRTFDKADQELLQRFANHAAIAIENANAYAAEHEARANLSRLISSSLDGIIAVDRDGYVTVYNDGAERICGYSADEILQQKTRVDKIYGKLEIAQEINRILFKQEKLDNYEAFLRAKNGQKIPITLSATLLRDKDNNFNGSVGFFKDLRPLRATLETITAVTEAQDLIAGLNALAKGMVTSLGVAFCQILFLTRNHQSLRVDAAHPVARSHGEPLQWEPEIGKILDLNDAPFLKEFLKTSGPFVYRREGSALDLLITHYIQKIVGLKDDVESALVIPLKSNDSALGICILGEVRKWERSPFTEERIRLAYSIANQAAGLIDRLQTYEALRLREGLLKAGREITSLQDLSKILQSIADGMRRALHCDLVTLYMYNEARDRIDLPTISGQLDHPDALDKLGYVSKKSIVWKILESGTPHFANDSQNDPWMILAEADRHPGVDPFVLRERILSSAGIPLIMGNEKVGIVFASYRSTHTFLDKEKSDVQLFATQAAIAINNARLVKKEEKKRKHLEAVINASKVITASVGLTRQEIIQRILEQAVETIKSTRGRNATLGTIQLLEEPTRELVFEYAYPESLLPELQVALHDRLPLDAAQNQSMPKGITVRAACLGTPQLVPDTLLDPDYVVYHDQTRSELAVPLLDGERLVGVLDVENDQPYAFDEEDAVALQALADMAVVALNNVEVAGQLSFANTVASMGAWGAEIAHDVNRETGAIQRKIYLLQQYGTDFTSMDVRRILGEIESYAESLVLPPLPKQAPKPGEIIETKNAAKLDLVVASSIDSMKSIYPDVVLIYQLHCEDLRAAIHEHWLRRLLRHLVRNAIKATEGRPIRRVLVRTSVESGFVKVEIEDSGKGVRPEIRARLFKQPIRHEDDDRDGQGLLIVRFLTERHGGKSGINWTQPEQGSCFYFTLPIIRTEFAQ